MDRIESEFVDCDLCGARNDTPLFNARDFRFGHPEMFSFVECSSCGLIYLNPRPDLDSILKFYEIDYTPENDQSAATVPIIKGWKALMIKFGRRIIGSYTDEIIAQSTGRVLDIGCGNGYLLQSLKQKGCEVFGVEANENSVKKCHKLGLDVFHGFLEEARFPDSFFDTTILSQVLEHLPSPKKTLKEVWRILKPGGKVFIFMPNTESYLAAVFGKYWHGWHIPFHFYVLSGKIIQKLANVTGFTISKISSVTPTRFFTVSLKGYLWGEKNGNIKPVERGWFFDSSLFVITMSLLFRILDFIMPEKGDCLKIIMTKMTDERK